MKKLIVVLLLIFTSISAIPFVALSQTDTIDASIDGIISYKLKETDSAEIGAWIDGALTQGAGETSEWYVLALNKYMQSPDFTSYTDALEAYLSVGTSSGAAIKQRYALALIACGRAENAFVAETVENTIGEQGIMSFIFGLHILNNIEKSENINVSDVVSDILSLRLADGGWAITGENSDVDVTSMALQAISPYCGQADVSAAVNDALDFLSEKQLDNGGFMSYGVENPESAAQVIIALTSLGIDPLTDERFIKNDKTALDAMLAFSLNDGSFSHISGGAVNNMATSQALLALVSLKNFYEDKAPLYLFTEYPEPTEPSEPEQTPPVEKQEDPEPVEPESDTVSVPESDGEIYDYKPITIIVILAVAVLICLIFFITGRRGIKNFIFILVFALIAVLFVFFTDFRSASDYYKNHIEEKTSIGTVTLTINCETAVGKSDSEYIPSDGVILPVTDFPIAEGETVFDVLVEAARKNNIHIDNSGSVSGDNTLVYIKGINYLYEFDLGELSGWICHVNGTAISVGCGSYILSDGDEIEWLYTLDLGKDVE